MPAPSLLEVVLASVNIMQVRITRSRMAGDPPEVMIAPQLAHLGLMDFYRAEEAIAEGQRAAEMMLPFLKKSGSVWTVRLIATGRTLNARLRWAKKRSRVSGAHWRPWWCRVWSPCGC